TKGVPAVLDVLGNDVPGAKPIDTTKVWLLDPADNTFKPTVTIPNEGTFAADPITGKVTFTPLPAFVGTTTPLTYRITDGAGLTDTALIKVTVTETAQPVLLPDVGTTPQNTPITVDVLANDSGPGSPLQPTSVLLKDSDGTFKPSITVPGEGTYAADPVTGKVTFTPLPSFTGPATPVTYQVTNAAGVSATTTVTLSVTAVLPKAVDDAKTTPADTTVTVPVLANDTPGSAGAALVPGSVKLLNPSTGGYGSTLTISGVGVYTVDPSTGAVTFDPEPAFTGVAPAVTYQVSDSNGTPVTALLTITVSAAALAVPLPDLVTTPQGKPVTFDPLANDTPGAKPLDPKTVLLKDPADGVFKPTVKIPGEGTYSVDPITGKVTFTPEPGFSGPGTPLTYQVKDTSGNPVTSTVTLTVTPVKPVAVNDTAATAAGTPVSIPVLGNDTPGSATV
ncbi:MAG: Ig-like domain-containing protein, partial [Angustibacter sp.]